MFEVIKYASEIIKYYREHVEYYLEGQATYGSLGVDLGISTALLLNPGTDRNIEVTVIDTGIHLLIPPSYEIQIRIRFSIAKKGIIVPNSLGTIDSDYIDSDYNGSIKILLYNLTHKYVEITGRFVQLVLAR